MPPPRPNRVRRRRRPSGTVVISRDIVTLQAPARFAPSVETCPIRYSFIRERPGTEIHINIKDKNGNTIKRNNLSIGDLMYGPTDRSGIWEWDGKDENGHYVTPLQSPLSVQIRHKSGVALSKQVNIEIGEISLWAEGYNQNNRFLMNIPDDKKAVVATVYLKKTDGSYARTRVPIDVSFSFEDPNDFNTAKNNSFKYQNGPDKYLGGDNTSIHWAADPSWITNSDDGFKTKCKVAVNLNPGTNLAKAKVFFKPSSVGGNDFKLKATVYALDGTTVLKGVIGRVLTVWRSITFNKIYEMQGENHVSVNASSAIISPVFDPAFVMYSAGATTAIDAAHSIKYIGLWKNTATPQENWATLQRKQADEIPTATEITDAKYSGAEPASLVKRATARTAIIAKAQKWTDRIDSAFHNAMPKWISDAGIPSNALIAIQYYHPKYSTSGGDTATNEWKLGEVNTPAWLRVNAFAKSGGGYYYMNLDPDRGWVPGGEWGGLSHGNGIVSVPKGMAVATIKQVIRHEAGHATKSFFKRDDFGPSLDHSTSNAGIMYYTTAGGTTFTDREKKILRGIVP